MNFVLTSNNTTHFALCFVGKNSAYNVTLCKKKNISNAFREK